jgi:diacylglycerol kinase family enzyme
MLLIVNPYATTVSDGLSNLVLHALQSSYEVDAIDTQSRGHAVELCREAAHEGYDVVVAFGGDGTVNEAANGLIGSATPLTCLPGGSANVYCKMLGIPGELVDATEHLLKIAEDWRPRRVDVGLVNGRHFAFSSGLGLDASVVQRVDSNPRLKARFGPWYFTSATVATFWRRYLLRAPRMLTEIHGQGPADIQDAFERDVPGRDAPADGPGDAVEGITTIVQNGSPFTYFRDRPIEIADGATLEGGTLSCCVLERANPLDMPFISWRAFSCKARFSRHRRVSAFSEVTGLTVRTADGAPLPLQVDGDYVGAVAEARYSIKPRALMVVS